MDISELLCKFTTLQKLIKRGLQMARITITIPDNLQTQVLKLAKKDGGSVSYTSARLIELGFLIVNNKNKNQDERSANNIDNYCNQLIIKINGILKELAINNYNLTPDKIAHITKETILKYQELSEENKHS